MENEEEQEQEQTQEPERLRDDDQDEFGFYFQFVKSLVFYLRDVQERGAVSNWIIKLRQSDKEPERRVEWTKLLLFCLQRRRLPQLFAKEPDRDAPLPEFPNGMKLKDMMRWVISEEQKSQQAGKGDNEDYVVETSADQKEYVAIQKVPQYGVHCYMAVSNEPMTEWNHHKDTTEEDPCEQQSVAPESGGEGTMKPKAPPMTTKVTRPRSQRMAFPETESEMGDDILLEPYDEADMVSGAPVPGRAKFNQAAPAHSTFVGADMRGRNRVHKTDESVDMQGNRVSSSAISMGLQGAVRDTVDGTMLHVRKTMGARDVDQQEKKTRPCEGGYMSDETWEDFQRRYKLLCDRDSVNTDSESCAPDCPGPSPNRRQSYRGNR